MLQTVISGNLGSDPETKIVGDGISVCVFSVAAKNRKDTVWVKVNAWRQLADISQRYLKKGSGVIITGVMTASAYMGKDGTAKASLDLNADQIEFTSRAAQSDDNPVPATPRNEFIAINVDDEELPF